MATLLTISKGDVGPIPITIPHAGMTGPLSGYQELWMTAKFSNQDPDTASAGFPQAVFQKKKTTAGITVTTAGSTSVDGVISVALAQTDTSNLLYDQDVTLYWDVKGKDSTGLENKLASGALLVQAHATKA